MAVGRLLWVGPLALAVSLVATVLVRTVVVAGLDVSSEFEPLRVGSVIFFTTIGVVGAISVFAVVAKMARRPVALYIKIALVALLLSWGLDVDLLLSEPYEDTGFDTVGTLMAMHVVVAVIAVTLLVRLTRSTSTES